jgi:hypothetical protein
LATGGANLPERLPCGVIVNLEHINKRTLLGQGESDRLANARSRAGHDGSLSRKAEHAR